MFGCAGYFYLSTTALLETSIQTTGKVVGSVKKQKHGKVLYRPVVLFTDKDSNAVKFKLGKASNTVVYETDEKVDVIYDPNNPEKAKIKDFSSMWGKTLAFILIGIIHFFYGGRELKKLNVKM